MWLWQSCVPLLLGKPFTIRDLSLLWVKLGSMIRSFGVVTFLHLKKKTKTLNHQLFYFRGLLGTWSQSQLTVGKQAPRPGQVTMFLFVWNEPRIFFLWGKSAKHCTTVLPPNKAAVNKQNRILLLTLFAQRMCAWFMQANRFTFALFEFYLRQVVLEC